MTVASDKKYNLGEAACHEKTIIKCCENLINPEKSKGHYLSEIQSKKPISFILNEAERIVECLLDKYGSLSGLSSAMSTYCKKDQKLPSAVLKTVLCSVARDNDLCSNVINQIYSLYCDCKSGDEFDILTGVLYDSRLRKVKKPSLRSRCGFFIYQPAAYFMIHRGEFYQKMSSIFLGGVPSINKILSDYTWMDEESRALMDDELSRRVYMSIIPDDSDIREVLKDKLSNRHDMKQRLHHLFRCDIERNIDEKFKLRLAYTFDFMDSLSVDDVSYSLSQVSEGLKNWMVNGYDYEISKHDDPVSSLLMIFQRTNRYGFDPMIEMMSIIGFNGGLPEFTKFAIGEVVSKDSKGENSLICMAAGLLNMDTEEILQHELSENALAWFYSKTGRDAYRKSLQMTNIGRDIVFGHDLGL